MSNVIEIKWYQEQRRREKERAREALRELLTGSPSVAPASGVAPAPGKVVVIPGKSDDPDELEVVKSHPVARSRPHLFGPRNLICGCRVTGSINFRAFATLAERRGQHGTTRPAGSELAGRARAVSPSNHIQL
jgi:hypothetical protein